MSDSINEQRPKLVDVIAAALCANEERRTDDGETWRGDSTDDVAALIADALLDEITALPVPAAPSVSTDDEKLKAELLRLCVPMQHRNGYPVEAIPKAALLDFFAIRALGASRG